MNRIPYVIVLASDLERSKRFYRDDLGLSERTDPPSDDGRVAFAMQGTTLVLLSNQGGSAGKHALPGETPAGRSYPSFTVPDIQAFHQRIVARGVRCLRAPEQQPFGKLAFYADPDGLPISIVEKRKVKDKQAVVLSGGGAFGAFEIGVLRALVGGESPSTGKTPIEPEIFTGTSAGAYNAAVLASRTDLDAKDSVEYLAELWLKRLAGDLHNNGVLRLRGDPIRMLDPRHRSRGPLQPLLDLTSDTAHLSTDLARRLAYFALGKGSLVRRLMEIVDFASFISTEPLHQLVSDTILFADIARSERILKVAATNWTTGAPRLFVHDPSKNQADGKENGEEPLTDKNVALAVLASTAIPGVFPAVDIDGTPYVDGGVVMNTPLKPAIDAGATVIHLICLNPNASTVPLEGPPNTLDIFERLLNTAVSAHVDSDLDTARFINSVAGVARRRQTGELFRELTIHRYQPDIDLGGLAGMLDFRMDRIQSRIQAGRDHAQKHTCEGCVIPSQRPEQVIRMAAATE